MDPQKKVLILHWVSNVWGKKAETFLELKDGHFFQHVLNLLEHKTEGSEHSSADQFCEVQKYLEDHYGKEARINEILKFDELIGRQASQENDLDMEMELAKIAAFLLSLALFSTKGNQIVAAASLDLPVQMHGDIKNIVQSVVETQCTDSVCSSTIEDVLRSPSGEEKSFDENSMKAFFEKPLSHSLTPKEQRLLREMSPIEAPANDGPASVNDNHPKNTVDSQSSISENLFVSRDGASSPPMRNEFSLTDLPMRSTPKYSKVPTVNASKMLPTESPLPLNVSAYNVSFGISSPFRALNISATSSYSPLANFIQSPEIIQKVLLKKRELELNKMKRELNNQVYLCEDLQITIQDNIKTITSKDAEIEKLKMRVKELLSLQDAKDELEEIKPKLSDLEATVEKLNGKLFKLEYYKGQCQILEKENSDQREEIRQLHEEVKSLEVDNCEKKDLLLVKNQMKIQIETLEAQVSEMTKGKTELEDKCDVLQGKLVHANQQYEQLQGEFDELHGTNNDSVQGESMGVIVEVQLGELRLQVEELTQIRGDLMEELGALKESLRDKEREILEVNQQLGEQKNAKTNLETELQSTEKDLTTLKEESSLKDAHIEQMSKTLSDLNVKLEEERSIVAEQKTCHEALMSEKLKAIDEVTEKCREYEEQILSLHKELKEAKVTISSEQEKNMDLMSQITRREEEIMSAKKIEENLLKEIDNLKKEIDFLKKEREILTENAEEEGNKLSECKQILDKKDQELLDVKTTLEELKTVIGKKDEEMHALVTNMALKESAKEEMSMKMKLCEREICSLKNCISEKEEELEDLKSKQRETVSTLEEKIRLIFEEKENLTQSLDVKCAQMEETSEKLKSKENDFSSLQEQYAKANVVLSELQECVKSTEENLLATKQQLEAKYTEYALLKEELSQKTNDHEQLMKEKENACSVAQEKSSQLGTAVLELEEKVKLLEENCSSITHQLAEKESETSNLIEAIEEKDRVLKSKVEDFSSLQEQYAKANVALSELQECVKSTEENLLATKQQLEEKNTEFTLLSKKFSEKTNDLEQMIKEKEDACFAAQEKSSHLGTAVLELEEKVKLLEENCSRLTHQLVEKGGETVNLMEAIEKKEEELKFKEKDFSSLQEQYAKVNVALSELQECVKCTEENLLTTKQQLEAKNAELTLLNEKLSQKTNDHEQMMKEKEDACFAAQEKSSHLGTAVLELEEKVKVLEENCSNLKCQLAEKGGETVNLMEAIEKKDEELKFKEKDFSSLQEQYAKVNVALSELQECMKCTEENLLTTKQQLEEKNAEFTLLNEKLSQKTNDHEQMMKEKEDACSVAQEKSSQLGTAVLELEENVKVLKENCASLTHKLAEKESETSNLIEAIEEKDRELQQYVHSTSEHEKYVTQLREEFNIIEKEHTDLKTKLENALSEVSFFQKALHESESRNKEFEMKLESGLSEQKSLSEKHDNKLEELNQLKRDIEKSEENHESQLLAFKGEISFLKSDIQEKEEEIEKLRQECENRSHQLTERQAEVDALMASTSNDQKIMEAKLLDYSRQVSNVIAQIKEKEQDMLAKDNEICDLNLKIDQQDKLIEDLTSNAEQVRVSLSEMQCLKESCEISRDDVKNKLEEKENEVSKLHADMQATEERTLELVHRLEEEVSHLQQQAAVLEDKDNLIHQLEKELAMMRDVKKTLNLKEQELSSLTEECHAMREWHKDEMDLLHKENVSIMCSILHYVRESLESEKENQDEDFQLENIAEDTLSVIRATVEEIRQKYKAKKVDLEEVMKTHEETESSWRRRMEELKIEREEERISESANHELEIVKAREEVELNWNKKWNDYQLQVTEERKEEAAKSERQIVQLRESLAAQWEKKCDDLQAKYANDLKEEVERLEKEKHLIREELNSGWQDALDDLQMEFEAAKASEMKTLSQQKAELFELKENYETKLTVQRMESDKLLKSVHEENTKLLERETAHLKNTETQMKTANEYCNSLKKQLEGTTGKLTVLEQEILSLKEHNQKQNDQLARVRETNESLNSALHIERDTNAKMQQRMENYISKLNNSKLLNEKTQQENKSYAVEVNKLKTSLDYSERKLQEYKHQLDQAGTALLGDSSHFHRIVQEHDNALDDSLMEKEAHTPRYSLRSSIETRQSFVSPNETIISGDTVMLKRETMASSSDIKRNASPRSRLSISSTTSSMSNKSVNGLPPGVRPNMQSCANEPEEFEWDRLSELQRRNTLCLPHMKSSYPVEIQNVKKDKFSDDSLRLSIMPRRKATPDHKGASETGKLGKRKSPAALKQTDMTTPKQKKPEVSPGGTVLYFPLAKDGPVYPPLRPPTPGRQRKHGKGSTSSPHSGTRNKVLGSTIARRKQHTPSPRKSPRLNPKSPRVMNREDHENKLQESIAFNIGFTPDKNGGRKRMLKKRDASNTTSAAIKTLTNVKQMMKEVSRQTDINDENICAVKMQGNCDMTHTNLSLRKSLEKGQRKKFSSCGTNEELNVSVMEQNLHRHQVGEEGLIKRNFVAQSNFCDDSKARNFIGDRKFENYKKDLNLGVPSMTIKPRSTSFSNTIRPSSLVEMDDVFVDNNVNCSRTLPQPNDADVEEEPVIVRNTLNGRTRKSVTFSSDVGEEDSGVCPKTSDHGKNMTKAKGKVAKLVSLFTSHSTQKGSGKESKKNTKKAKHKVSPRRSFRLQSPLVYNPLAHRRSPYVNISSRTPMTLSAKGTIKTQSVFPSPGLVVLNDCSTPVTSKGKRPRRKLFTPNKVNPSSGNLGESRPVT